MKKEEILRLAGINEQRDYPYSCGYMIGSAKSAIRNLGHALRMSEIYSDHDQDKALYILTKAIQEVTAKLEQDIQSATTVASIGSNRSEQA
jgi:hypothetical protein